MNYDPAGEGDEYNGAYDEEYMEQMAILQANEHVESHIETKKYPCKMDFDEFLDNFIEGYLPAQNFIQSWVNYDRST
tara:strand:- start:2558 stop:2788 length:231 start_codon:yes stop_codon:yes gene_type:complete